MRSETKVPFGEALDKLEKAARSTPSDYPMPTTIDPAEIKFAPDVFQPRVIGGAMGEDEGHVRELRRGLRAKGKEGEGVTVRPRRLWKAEQRGVLSAA